MEPDDQFENEARVAPPEGNDDQSYREYGRQLAMDALLELALHTPRPTAAQVTAAAAIPFRLRRYWKSLATIAAVCVIAAIIPLALRDRQKIAPEMIARHDPMPLPPGPMSPPPKASPEFDVTGWQVEPTGRAAIQMITASHIRLDRGELRVAPDPMAAREPLTIETEFGTVTADQDGEFLIGFYPTSSKGNGTLMHSPLVRVLVLAGIVTLSTPAGSLTGGSGHLLAAEANQPPTDFAVQASTGFAFDLYRELAESNSDSGIFFSPYSLSLALAMTAEGARGETAEQMAGVLRLPDAARRIGDDAQDVPFNMALIHTGYATLNKRWNNEKAGDREVRKQIEVLRKELADANNHAAALRKAKKEQESNKVAVKSQEIASRLNALLGQVDQFELRVANALWGEQTYPFRKEYVETIHRYYSAGGVFPVDFKDQYEAARQQINRWAADQTAQKIPELISRFAISPEDGRRVRLILTNAIYFKGEWTTVFQENETKEADFLLSNGNKVRTLLMHHGHLGAGYAAFNGDGTYFDTPLSVPVFGNQPQTYPDDEGFAVLELPYKGEQLSMIVIAPRSPDRLPAVEKLLTAERWPALSKSLASRAVDTYIPRFKMEKSFELSSVMKAMGMDRPFEIPGPDGQGAQFDGMCASDDPQHRLYIGKVLHAAQVEVTEKGTEAAAATAVITVAPPSALPESRPFVPQFRADRPFTFLIRDRKSDTILFMGRVVSPTSQAKPVLPAAKTR